MQIIRLVSLVGARQRVIWPTNYQKLSCIPANGREPRVHEMRLSNKSELVSTHAGTFSMFTVERRVGCIVSHQNLLKT